MKLINKKACTLFAGFIGMTIPLSSALADLDIQRISKDALIKAPETVECTLENGTTTMCGKFVVKYQPDNLEIGPFCATTVKDEGGIWDWDGEMAGLYRINEKFLTMLSELGYQFYDEDTGKGHVTDIRTEKPVDKNACLEASVDKTVEITVLLPLTPVKAEQTTDLGTVAKVGLALDGVPIFADAPSVLDTGHMPALDTCGGHVDPGGWYHWHATATDIKTVYDHEHVQADCGLEQKASAMFAYAFDGFPIYGSVDQNGVIPTDLDSCNGHLSATVDNPQGAYHYHASTTFPNLPSCLSGVVAKNNFSTTAAQGIGSANSGKGGHGGPRPDFTKAADTLGVSLHKFQHAIMDNGGRDLDISAAAKDLDVTEAELKAVLPSRPAK